MRFFVSITDFEWFSMHASKSHVEEVNFWKPSPNATFKALQPGELFLFKLHAPNNFIVGGGFFTKFLTLPMSLAWDAFGEANGARSLDEVRERISKYRKTIISSHEDPQIGCIMLAEPFFFDRDSWIPSKPYFPAHTQVGKTYDATEGAGQRLWSEVSERLKQIKVAADNPGPALCFVAEERERYGHPMMVSPRLGQGLFRVLVTDAYHRCCAMTQERTLPVLEAAHIKPYSAGGQHELSNGLLLRSDLHRLFDRGYLTIDPGDHKIVVSNRLKEEFDNGKEYYPLRERTIILPSDPAARPSREHLQYHADHVFH